MSIYQPSGKIRVWNVWYYNSGWVADGYFPRAGIEPFIDIKTTSAQTLTLADGSQVHTSPESYRIRGELTLMIPAEQLTAAYKDKINAYMCSGAGIRIQTHEADTIYLEGFIIALGDTWQLSGKKQKHVYELTFQMFDVDGSGNI